MSPPHTHSLKPVMSSVIPADSVLRVEFKRKAVVHLDQHNRPIASVSLSDNGPVHTIAINTLTVFDVVHTHPLLASSLRARNTHYLRTCKVRRIEQILRSSVDNPIEWVAATHSGSSFMTLHQCVCVATTKGGPTMAKRKKQSSKVQKKKAAKARPKAKKAAGKATKRVVAKAKPKRKAAKKAAPPVATAVEIVAVEVVEQPAPAE